jgi:parallel beta-helix repeat protein
LSLKIFKHRARIFVALMIIMQILLMPLAAIAADNLTPLDNAPAEASAPAPDPSPEPDPTPEPAADPTPTSDPAPGSEPAPADDPTPDPVADSEPADDPAPAPDSSPAPDPTPEPAADPTPASDPAPGSEPAPADDPTPVPVADSESAADPATEPETNAGDPEPESDLEPENETPPAEDITSAEPADDPALTPETDLTGLAGDESAEVSAVDVEGVADAGSDEAPVKGNSYKAELTPGGVVGLNQLTEFVVKFTELNADGQQLGSAQMTIDSNFTPEENSGIVTASNNYTWGFSLVDMVLSLWAQHEDGYLGYNESVSVVFKAITPTEDDVSGTETFTFETEAWMTANADHSGVAGGTGNNDMATGYNDPTVTVSKSIQGAISSSAIVDGDTVFVHSGNYTGPININKELSLLGTQAGVSGGDRSFDSGSESTIRGIINVNAENVTIDGFTLTNPGGNRAVEVNKNNATIENNIIRNIGGTSYTGSNVFAVSVQNGPDNVQILNNWFYDISAKGKTVGAIYVGHSKSNNPSDNLIIEGNTFNTIRSLYRSFFNPGKGAYAILFNNGAGVNDALIKDNTIDGVTGWWARGIGLEGPTIDAIVTGNEIQNLNATGNILGIKTHYSTGVYFEANAYGGTALINGNSFTSMDRGIDIHASDRNSFIIDASGNWWGTDDPGLVRLNLRGGARNRIDFSPMLASGADLDSSAPGFQPDLSELIVHTLGAQTGDVGRIKEGLDTVGDAGTVTVLPGTYEENILIDRFGLALRSSEGPEKTILQGYGVDLDDPDNFFIVDTGIQILNDNVTVEGFTVQGYDFGIDSFGNNNTINNNRIFCNYDGIALWDSEYNIVSGNTIIGSGSDGFGNGIWLWSANNNSITDNVINHNTIGIYLDAATNNLVSDNLISKNWAGLYLGDADDNEITENTIADNDDGVFLYQSNNNAIEKNDISGSLLTGISLESSNDNRLFENTIHNNGLINDGNAVRGFGPGMFPGGGIGLISSNGNLINRNDIFGNYGYGVFYENNLPDGDDYVDATNNWWGSDDGPSTHNNDFVAPDGYVLDPVTGKPADGIGDAVSENVHFDQADDGSDDGSDDGTDDGADDGSDDGTDDGADDGSDDGTDDGSDDGTEDGSDDEGEEEGEGTTTLPLLAPFAPIDFPATPATAAVPAAPVQLATTVGETAPAPVAETVVVTPEQVAVQPEAPATEPGEEGVSAVSAFNSWLFLLLLIPILIWFLLAHQVVVLVPKGNDEYKVVARKLALRRDKRYFVDIEKQLTQYLAKHGELIVEFKGGLVSDARKAIYSGEIVLSADEKKYAMINRQRYTSWLNELKKQVSKTA